MGYLYTKSHENLCSVASNFEDSEAHVELRAQIPHSLEAQIEGVSTVFLHILPTERLRGQQPASESLSANVPGMEDFITGILNCLSSLSSTETTKVDTVPAFSMAKSIGGLFRMSRARSLTKNVIFARE